MVFCNVKLFDGLKWEEESHNPYFNRWFSAIYKVKKVIYKGKGSQSLF